jgi:phytoene synthase
LSSPREVIQKGSKSFALAALFLPQATRREIYTLYAWFRHCDDVIDESNSQLADLEKLKAATFSPAPASDFKDLQKLIEQKKLQTFYFNEFFEGLRMDLENKGYATLLDLELYCYRVAGVVGLIMSPLIGVSQQKALKHACSLGIAMQLTNICRDVLEDAQNNRIYLPRQLLKKDLTADQLSKSPELAQNAVLKLLSRAEEFYQHGNLGLKFLPFRVAVAIGSASYIYREIGKKIIKDGKYSLNRRVVVGTIGKFKCVILGFYAAMASRLQRPSSSTEPGLTILTHKHLDI